jgi:DNA-binding NtrC family response regulator
MKYVVVIDDEIMVEEYLEAFLRKADYREISFNDPREAFDFIKEHPVTKYASSLQILTCLK